MPKRVLCKFSAHGACLKGEHCEFSHDWKDPPNNICTFHLKGVCAYGSRCRYEHLIFSRVPSPTPSLEDVSSPVEHLSETVVLREVDDCPCGNNCPQIRGEDSPILQEQCSRSLRNQENECMKIIENRKKHLEVLRHSREIECSVCLEAVLSKPTSAERKFGILSECDHMFCLSCIRNWRSTSLASGLNANSAVRACPICRKHSYFVVPSTIWFTSKEEKLNIINKYKENLSFIDCKHFNFGNGTCPFGTRCFYKHAYQDGRLVQAVQSPSGG